MWSTQPWICINCINLNWITNHEDSFQHKLVLYASSVVVEIYCKLYSIACVFVFGEIPIGALYGKFDSRREEWGTHLLSQELRIKCDDCGIKAFNKKCFTTIDHSAKNKISKLLIACLKQYCCLDRYGRSSLIKSVSTDHSRLPPKNLPWLAFSVQKITIKGE